jgi:hypothetical protein
MSEMKAVCFFETSVTTDRTAECENLEERSFSFYVSVLYSP